MKRAASGGLLAPLWRHEAGAVATGLTAAAAPVVKRPHAETLDAPPFRDGMTSLAAAPAITLAPPTASSKLPPSWTTNGPFGSPQMVVVEPPLTAEAPPSLPAAACLPIFHQAPPAPGPQQSPGTAGSLASFFQQQPRFQQGPSAAPRLGGKVAAAVSSDTRALLDQLQAQLALRQQAASQQQAGGGWHALGALPSDPRALTELLLLLTVVHDEYKSEMRLLLRACQVAASISQRHHAGGAGATLQLDAASRDQLQRQVLANANEKHAAVVGAFKAAAQATALAATAAGLPAAGPHSDQLRQLAAACADTPTAVNTAAAAAAAVERSGSTAATPTAQLQLQAVLQAAADEQRPDHGQAAAAGDPAVLTSALHGLLRCLQQLHAAYQQELVAATSAVVAICKGFCGPRVALTPAAHAALRGALGAAHARHARVAQLWQDMLAAAGGASE